MSGQSSTDRDDSGLVSTDGNTGGRNQLFPFQSAAVDWALRTKPRRTEMQRIGAWRLCMDCGVQRTEHNSQGWLSESRPTHGCAPIMVELCFRCRHLTIPEGDPLAALADFHRWIDDTRRLKVSAGK